MLQRIFNQLSNRLANKGMVTWKAYDRKMQELERFQDRQEQLMWNLLARLCNQKMAQGFETWIILTNELRRHEVILERAARRMQNRKLNGSFRGWVVYVKTRKYNRKLMKNILSRLCNQKVYGALILWKFSMKEGRRHEVIMRRVAGKISRRLIAASATAFLELPAPFLL